MLTANHERCYATGDLHVVADNLLVAEGGKSRIEYLAEKYTKKQSPKTLSRELAAYPSREQGAILVAGYENGIEIHNANLVCGTASLVLSSHRPDVHITLGDPLHVLRAYLTDNAPIGVVTKEGTRILRGGQGGFVADVTAKYYAKLTDALAHSDLKKANKVIDAYLNEDFCAIDRTVYAISGGFKRMFAPLTKRNEESTRTLDILASKNDYGSTIVSVRPELDVGEREKLAEKISKAYRVSCSALETSPTLILKGPKQDVDTVTKRLQLSRPCLHAMRAIVDVRPSRMRVAPLPKVKQKCSRTERLLHVEMLNAYAAHQYTQGEGVVGAVMDSGVDYNHSALRTNFDDDKGYDFVRNTDDPLDREGHGTHVAGIWAAIAPKVMLKSVRVLDELGRGSEADILLGYEYCYKNNIPLINCSFGSEWFSEPERRVVEAARSYNCIIVAAAGNESENERSPDRISYPAAFSGVQSIGSINGQWKHSWFSNMGFVTFAALGEDVLSTLPGNEWGTMDGTSMASPSIAGALSLQLAANPELSIENRILIAHARCLQPDKERDQEWQRRYGFGVPDCELLVESQALWIGNSK
jgi:hypothetical protein